MYAPVDVDSSIVAQSRRAGRARTGSMPSPRLIPAAIDSRDGLCGQGLSMADTNKIAYAHENFCRPSRGLNVTVRDGHLIVGRSDEHGAGPRLPPECTRGQ
jgi:hypothetical protein